MAVGEYVDCTFSVLWCRVFGRQVPTFRKKSRLPFLRENEDSPEDGRIMLINVYETTPH